MKTLIWKTICTRISMCGCLVVGASTLAGCAVGPNYKTPDVPVAGAWHTQKAGGEKEGVPDVAEWWKQFKDPTLDSLVQQAMAANFDLRVAKARVREARAARGIVASGWAPQVSAQGSYTHSQSVKPPSVSNKPSVSLGRGQGYGLTSTNVNVRTQHASVTIGRAGSFPTVNASVTPGGSPKIDRTHDLYQAGFDASWELDIFGGTRRAVEAANADIEAAQENHRDVMVSLLAEVARNYLDLRGTQRRLAIAHENIKAQKDSVKFSRARFEAGLTNELDVKQAEAQLAGTQAQVPLLETTIREDIHHLGVLTGQEPGALLGELSKPEPLPSAPVEVPVGLPSDLLRRRPDVRAAERQLAGATARIGVATADLFPKFSLTGALGGQSATLADIVNGSSRIWSVGPGITLPIFEGGKIRANIKVQKARQEQAAAMYEKTVMTSLEDTENALVAYAKEQDRRKSYAEAVAANKRAVEMSTELYQKGLVAFLNVLDSQRSLYSSQDLEVQSETAVLTRLVSLYKALGGGWEKALPETPPAGTMQTAKN